MDVKLIFDKGNEPYFPGETVQVNIELREKTNTDLKKVAVSLTGPDYNGQKIILNENLTLSANQTTHLEGYITIPTNPKPEIVFSTTTPEGKKQMQQYGPVWQIQLDAGNSNSPLATQKLNLIVPPPGLFSKPVECGFSVNGEISPTNHQMYNDPHLFMDTAGIHDMSLSLPKLEWVEGEAVTGKLIIEPQKDLTVQNLSIELFREAFQFQNPWKKSEQGQAIDSHIDLIQSPKTFKMGTREEFSFKLPMAKIGWPTRYTKNDVVRSKIRVRINSGSLSLTDWVTYIYVYNGAGQRLTYEQNPSIHDLPLTDSDVDRFFQNTARYWYSLKDKFRKAKALLHADEFYRYMAPQPGSILADLLTLGSFMPDEYLVETRKVENVQILSTNQRVLVKTGDQKPIQLNVNEIVSWKSSVVPAGTVIKTSAGNEIKFRAVTNKSDFIPDGQPVIMAAEVQPSAPEKPTRVDQTPPVVAPPPADEFTKITQKYLSMGYKQKSKTADSVQLERSSAAATAPLILSLMMFLPGGIFYLIHAGKKKYQVSIQKDENGKISVEEPQESEIEADKKRIARVGWIVVSLSVVLYIGFCIFGLIPYFQQF